MPEIKPPEIKSAPPTRSKSLFVGFVLDDGFTVECIDAIIVGTGQAGAPLAGRLSGAGMKIAIIERNLFGGTCVNTGCTPDSDG
jgi:ribulose 1,5-bisphosphate synthetase/thiazole synthase